MSGPAGGVVLVSGSLSRLAAVGCPSGCLLQSATV